MSALNKAIKKAREERLAGTKRERVPVERRGKTVYDGPVVGVRFCDFRLAPDRIADCELELVSEPLNPHDKNAIAVKTTDGRKVGYIPRTRTAPIHEAWSQSNITHVDVRVFREDPTSKTWSVRILVQVELPAPPEARIFGHAKLHVLIRNKA